MLLLLYGAFALISQTLLLWELSMLFQRNELVLGLLMFSWLAGGAGGSALFRHLPRAAKARKQLPLELMLAASVLLCLVILAVRWTCGLFLYQQRPSLAFISLLSFVFAAPVSLLTGLAFSSLAASTQTGKTLSRAYALEAVGAFLGGVLYFFVLAGRLDPLLVALLMALAFSTLWARQLSLSGRMGWFLSIPIPALGFLLLLAGADKLVWFSRVAQFRGSELVSSENSRYGNLSLVKNGELTTAYYNGEVLYNSDSRDYEEKAILPQLAGLPCVGVLFLGFPPPPLLDEVLKLKPYWVTAVFQDAMLESVLKEHLGGKLNGREFPRVQILLEDPYAWARRQSSTFDLAYIQQGLPSSLAENRMFSLGLVKVIEPCRLACFSAPYEEGYLSGPLLESFKMVWNTLKTSFPETAALAGNELYFVASTADSGLNLEMNSIQMIWKHLAKDARFVNPGSLKQVFDPERLAKFNTLLNSEPKGKVNTLFSTDLYRFGLQRWLAMDPWQGRAAMGAVLLALAILAVRRFREFKAWAGADKRSLFLFALGFSYMAGEIQLLFFFQSVTGFVYGAYALLTGVFMLGLAGGGFAGRCLGKGSGVARKILYILAIAWPAVIGGLFFNENIGIDAANFSAFSLNLVGGFLLGTVFNLETSLLEAKRAKAESLASKLYSFDLAGSALAALLAPALLIPFLGHFATAAMGCLLLLAAMVWKGGWHEA